MAARRRGSCPNCGNVRIVPVVYGMPDDETFAAASRGEIALGGCVIVGDDPDRECRDCGHRWTAAKGSAGRRQGR